MAQIFQYNKVWLQLNTLWVLKLFQIIDYMGILLRYQIFVWVSNRKSFEPMKAKYKLVGYAANLRLECPNNNILLAKLIVYKYKIKNNEDKMKIENSIYYKQKTLSQILSSSNRFEIQFIQSQIQINSHFQYYNITFLLPNMSHTKILNQSAFKSQMHMLSNNYSPQDFNKSSTKRLYESVFRIIDFEESQISQFNQQATNGSRITQFVKDEGFLTQIYRQMKDQNILENYPILKVSIQQNNSYRSKSISGNCQTFFELDFADLLLSFSKIGHIYRLLLSGDSKIAYILFTQFHAAYMSMKLLNNIQVRGKMGKLNIAWANPNENSNILHELPVFMNSINWQLAYHFSNINLDEQSLNSQNQNQKQNKLTCRYDIQIQNQKQFQVARRIIGTKGCHMKKIIQQSLQLAKNNENIDSANFNSDNLNEILKLRLRGKGSGYKEGPDQLQSQQNLHLCISAKDQFCYQVACQKVQKLLQDVYTQYEDFTKNQGRRVSYKIKKINVGISSPPEFTSINAEAKQTYYSDSISNINYPSPMFTNQFGVNRMTPNKIQELLQMRNKARRQLNFIQADRIRNFLRSYGVCLIDQKGRRGKATQVTTWKYTI